MGVAAGEGFVYGAPREKMTGMSVEKKQFGAFAPSGLHKAIIRLTRSVPDTWLGRRAAFFLRKFAIRSLRGNPVDIDVFGARFRLFPFDNVCEKRILFTPQFFDSHELSILESRIADGFVFIDVGANIGAYSLFVAAKAGRQARIFAVEPQPEIFERLVYNISANPFGSVKALACAVADKPGDVTLFLNAQNRGESSVKIVGTLGGSYVRVPAKTLLGIIRDENLDHVDAMKLDVEGAEDLILDPFLKEAPAEVLPALLIVENGEGRWQVDLPVLLAERGYREIARTRLNRVYERA
jgi:FkbM family methyltransferase